MRIIAAFAGVGKSHFCEMYPNALDFVVMPFKYQNYTEVVSTLAEGESAKAHEELLLRYDWHDRYYHALMYTYRLFSGEVLVIPTEREILWRLEQENIPFTVVYPERSLKEEYRARYIARGNSESFLKVFIDRWDEWMYSVRLNGGTHIELQSGQFLSDVIQLPRGGSDIIENKEDYIKALAETEEEDQIVCKAIENIRSDWKQRIRELHAKMKEADREVEFVDAFDDDEQIDALFEEFTNMEIYGDG